MPNVPNVPGVPSLTSYSQNSVTLLVADAISLVNLILGPQWGIFAADTGFEAFDYNSIVDIDFKQDWPISDYQVENGGFQSYDKVQLPYDVKISVASGSTEPERQVFIQELLQLSNSLKTFDIVTPELTLSDACITHVDFRRSAHHGVGMIIADIWFIQIRETSTSTFSNTQSPTVAGNQNTGNYAPVAYLNAPFSASRFT